MFSKFIFGLLCAAYKEFDVSGAIIPSRQGKVIHFAGGMTDVGLNYLGIHG